MLRANEIHQGEGFVEKLEQECEDLIGKAIDRAKDNGRVTVYARDL